MNSNDLPAIAYQNNKQMAVLVRSNLKQNMFIIQIELPILGKRTFTEGEALLLQLFSLLLQ